MNKENRKARSWVFIGVGSTLIIVAAYFLISLFPSADSINTEGINQEGFESLYLPADAQRNPVRRSAGGPVENSPDRIIIEAIGLDAPVVKAETVITRVDNKEVIQFLVPEKFAAGWYDASAVLGEPGNTVISGHHNAFGKVFEHLIDLKEGEPFILKSGGKEFSYTIVKRLVVKEKNEPLRVRLENARWMMPTDDERVTLITCWPKRTNSHRLIIVGFPADQ